MSKIYINTLSPYELISPRYFETFASSTILLCEDTGCIVGFLKMSLNTLLLKMI